MRCSWSPWSLDAGASVVTWQEVGTDLEGAEVRHPRPLLTLTQACGACPTGVHLDRRNP